MKKRYDPMKAFANGLEVSMVMAEAQAVVGMRLMGMAGLWSVTPYEDRRMIEEKTDALVKSYTAANRAMMNGGDADDIAAAAIKPIRARTRANRRRLTKRGVKA
ncbi:antifreeze protein [Sulfitobacter albidus]|uniref:Antifreeze protein n=1 Tax=Sulfitobacter albidus TaxID=2829501 RepID=A0A975JEZ7_9RHOB|nr:antifreeze protein [Sulfitobacter albidus]QUJ77233.1 antifreeze protein [Sulfitobacter albidus]